MGLRWPDRPDNRGRNPSVKNTSLWSLEKVNKVWSTAGPQENREEARSNTLLLGHSIWERFLQHKACGRTGTTITDETSQFSTPVHLHLRQATMLNAYSQTQLCAIFAVQAPLQICNPKKIKLPFCITETFQRFFQKILFAWIIVYEQRCSEASTAKNLISAMWE